MVWALTLSVIGMLDQHDPHPIGIVLREVVAHSESVEVLGDCTIILDILHEVVVTRAMPS